MSKPTVFISYSHDSKEHAEKVLSFVNLLRKDGIECILRSWEDLEEAREIAHYGGMKPHLADYYLEACGNIRCQLSAVSGSGGNSGGECFVLENGERMALTGDGMREKFGEFLKEAERLIGETGYHRRDGELAALKEWGEDVGIDG